MHYKPLVFIMMMSAGMAWHYCMPFVMYDQKRKLKIVKKTLKVLFTSDIRLILKGQSVN